MLNQDTQWYKLQYPDCFISEEQRMIQKTVADFVDREIMPVRHKIDDDVTHELIIEPVLKKLQVDLGWQKAAIPKVYGGNESLSLVTAALKQEQLARADYGVSLASACVDWGLVPATMAYLLPYSAKAKAWGKAVLDEFAPRFVEDELRFACFNMSEVQSACDIENHLNEARLIRTKAVRNSGEWVVNGAKHWASNSGIADLHCLACNMDPASGVEGFALIYIPEPWRGVSHGKYEVKCGVNGDRNTSTYFDNARVPEPWGLQGEEAWDIFLNNVVSAFAMNIANCTGMMQGAFDVLLDYTGNRVVGGKPVREHLSTAMFLGEMVGAISIARGTFLQLC
ncbi:MAG: putative acyl-CoA dehydrogenase short-chain specific, partial [Firmicutes bacterium]|nr:putative acyl-CoA dehydrogenase short-chain specific [Bacillota bacterium]